MHQPTGSTQGTELNTYENRQNLFPNHARFKHRSSPEPSSGPGESHMFKKTSTFPPEPRQASGGPHMVKKPPASLLPGNPDFHHIFVDNKRKRGYTAPLLSQTKLPSENEFLPLRDSDMCIGTYRRSAHIRS